MKIAKNILEEHADRIKEEIVTWIPVDVLVPSAGPTGISEEVLVLVHNSRKDTTQPWSTRYSVNSREWLIQGHPQYSWDPRRQRDLTVTHWGYLSPME